MNPLRGALPRRIALLAATSALAVAAAGPQAASADGSGCTRVAAPGGSDSAPGTDAPTCTSSPICRLPSPTVNGDHVTFQDNDVTNRHQGICFNLGNASYGRAESDTIQRNRIHDCGQLPANNHEHGIYLSYADDTQ